MCMMEVSDFEMLGNRVRKMQPHIGKWARRQGISCYRLYDADIPEFPLAVDVYEDHLHVAEYRRRGSTDEAVHRQWRAACRQTLSEVLGIPMNRIFYKERRPQKGKQQYERQEERRYEITAYEDGLAFIINLSDYLDTGLFLDHRPLRRQVREQAMGKKVLNLFAYTGSFTVFAAAGGAVETLTIDLSQTYLDWAQRNLEQNQLAGPQHTFLQTDVTAWLREEPVATLFDLIILDPPTFSNSKRMRFDFDIQIEHPYLINRCLQRLTPDGRLYFSTNFRKFRLEPERIWQGAQIADISKATVPKDFRNQKIHYCWEITKR